MLLEKIYQECQGNDTITVVEIALAALQYL